MRKIILLPLILILVLVHTDVSGVSPTSTSYYTYRIINSFPHDPAAFTQGFLYRDGFFYESTGLYGRSSLRKVHPQTGRILQQINLPEKFFGEGLAICDERLIQLTWKEQLGLIYDLESFNLLKTFTYPTEGWGLTCDGRYLIMSDGSPTLTFLDPKTFTPIKRVIVKDQNKPVTKLNELEYIKGQIYANIWLTDYIVSIDPATGLVTGWIDLSGLLTPTSQPKHSVDVLNGIAYDDEGDRLFVTGKLWPRVFQIELIKKERDK